MAQATGIGPHSQLWLACMMRKQFGSAVLPTSHTLAQHLLSSPLSPFKEEYCEFWAACLARGNGNRILNRLFEGPAELMQRPMPQDAAESAGQ